MLCPTISGAQNRIKKRVPLLSGIADIRFLTYSNKCDLEGLIATKSIIKIRAAPESTLAILGAYKKIWPNLLKHEKGYPTHEELSLPVKKGLPVYGMEGVGNGHDSEGSEWIIKV